MSYFNFKKFKKKFKSLITFNPLDVLLGDVPKPPKFKTVTDEEEEKARKRRAAALKRRRGWASTIITGPLGVTEKPKTKKTTLGG